MYLQKLEIQGFKSFAHKVTLEFNRQLTAIVGPNGSGKSNIADAVRWVLGEQSIKLLRGKRAEDVIFAGSDTKSRLGMAEVSLFLNNEDKQAPVDFSEIVITRRVYRDGQSEYLLNGSQVRLQDIQILLAQANFGQKTYSVIGQGMVDSILLASPAERKEFFEEATGVKQYQLKREQAIQKLTATYENVEQAEAIMREIEPRLKTLTRQVKRLEKREEIEQELRQLQERYYRARYHELAHKQEQAGAAAAQLKQQITAEQGRAASLTAKLSELERDVAGVKQLRELEAKQQELRQRQAQLTKQQALAEAQAEIGELKRGAGELVLLRQRKGELEADAKRLERRAADLASEMAALKQRLGIKLKQQEAAVTEFERYQTEGGAGWLERELVAVSSEHTELRRKLTGATSLIEVKTILGAAQHIEERLQAAVKRLQRAGGGDSGELVKLLAARDQAMAGAAELQAQLAAVERELEFTGAEQARLKHIEVGLAAQLNGRGGDAPSIGASARELAATEQEITHIELKLSTFRSARENQSAEVFNVQRELTAATEQQRKLEQESHELELELARTETKLEDLEHELAQEVPAELSRSIKERGKVEVVDEGAVALELTRLKHQLELTGGIEPEVVTEYQQTKTRFDFLTTQVNDLESAANSLEQIIGDLDVTIERQFLASFKVINEKFVKYFQVLFGGGRVTLVLQKEEAEEKDEHELPAELSGSEEDKDRDSDEDEDEAVAQPTLRQKFLQREKVRARLFSGVEIQATPPGKKLSSITALSGGEKALTAIALISSIISNNPSPFVVLDEVDAALDEANSERYAAILDSLMDRTQFVTISHNRATMKRAAILYGVTMGEDGVSKLLSVKFDQADELAAKVGPKTKSKQ